MKNFLIVKLSAIGDVIHALPVAYALKETYPDSHLTWVVEPPAYDLVNVPVLLPGRRAESIQTGSDADQFQFPEGNRA